MVKKKTLRSACVALLALCLSAPALAQECPSHSILVHESETVITCKCQLPYKKAGARCQLSSEYVTLSRKVDEELNAIKRTSGNLRGYSNALEDWASLSETQRDQLYAKSLSLALSTSMTQLSGFRKLSDAQANAIRRTVLRNGMYEPQLQATLLPVMAANKFGSRLDGVKFFKNLVTSIENSGRPPKTAMLEGAAQILGIIYPPAGAVYNGGQYAVAVVTAYGSIYKASPEVSKMDTLTDHQLRTLTSLTTQYRDDYHRLQVMRRP